MVFAFAKKALLPVIIPEQGLCFFGESPKLFVSGRGYQEIEHASIPIPSSYYPVPGGWDLIICILQNPISPTSIKPLFCDRLRSGG